MTVKATFPLMMFLYSRMHKAVKVTQGMKTIGIIKKTMLLFSPASQTVMARNVRQTT